MIVAGFGFRKSATADSLQDAFAKAGGQADQFATLSDKAIAPAFVDFVKTAKRPVAAICADLAKTQATATRSGASISAKGIASVAEATALAAAGTGAVLTVTRVTSSDGRATCAIAKGATP